MRQLKIKKQSQKIKRLDTPLANSPKPFNLSLTSIHQGSDKTNPAVLKAKADKIKANSYLSAYKIKANAKKKKAILKAKADKIKANTKKK